MCVKAVTVTTLLLTLAGCGNLSFRDGAPSGTFDPESIAEIEPRIEPRSRGGNPKNYSIFGKTYHILKSSKGFSQRGDASWYGTKFHGRNTSNGERYDMYAITAAHKTLPIPTYLEVTNLENGQKLIVRVNDRGPFHSDRIIDLSYAAAAKLGYAKKGTAAVSIRAIDVAQYQREKHRTTPSRAPAQVFAKPLQSPPAAITAKATALPVERYTQQAAKNSPIIATRHDDKSRDRVSQQFYIQLGAYASRANAQQVIQRVATAQLTKIAIATIQPITRNSATVYRVRVGPFSSENAASEILRQLIQENIGNPKIFHGS